MERCEDGWDRGGVMRLKEVVVSGLAFLVWPVPLWAHHAFGGEFDANRPVLLRGEVTRVEWVNPHAWIHVAVKCDGQQGTDQIVCVGKPAGATEEWMIE